MAPSERICSNCSWRNEPDARMCGGCGRPLGTFVSTPIGMPSAPRRADRPLSTSTGAGGDAPTEYMPGGAYSPLNPTRSLDYGAVGAPPLPGSTPARWPAQAQPAPQSHLPSSLAAQPARRRGGSCLQRTLLALLALVLVTTCCSVGLWSFVVRPALHTATDSQIRDGLDSMFDEASNALNQALPLLPKGSHLNDIPIKAADINARLQEAAAKKGMPVNSSEVHFVGTDSVQVTYLLSGKPHSVTTHVYVVDGRVRARDTTDDFPLSLWESNAELETTINEALTHLTPDLHVTELHMAGDALYFSFTK